MANAEVNFGENVADENEPALVDEVSDDSAEHGLYCVGVDQPQFKEKHVCRGANHVNYGRLQRSLM